MACSKSQTLITVPDMAVALQKCAYLARAFVLCGHEPSLLWTPARRPSIGPVRKPMEREEGNWLVYAVYARHVGQVG